VKLTFAAALAAFACASPALAQPNVVIILTDDQRADTLQYMPTVESELMAKGVTFDNAFVVNPVCCPSRASILTGRWSHSTGVWGIDGDYGGFHVFNDASTLPVWLDRAGYKTALIGKYLNGYADGSYLPPGWDRWFAHTLHPNAYYGWEASDGGSAASFGSAPGDYNTDVLADRAVDFITDSGSDPFFLYFAPKAPHTSGSYHTTPAARHEGFYAGLTPWRPPNVNEADVSEKPDYIRSLATIPWASLDGLRESQLESLLAVDDAVGRMLAALAETGKLQETLIVFMSDNGHEWGEHRRAHKIVPYEESLRVPLVIRWDALGARGVSDRFALNVDIAPTIAAAAGIDAPKAEGRNLLPLLTGTASSWRNRFLIEDRMEPRWAVPAYCGYRGERWKYIQYATGEEELYDLVRDPYELENLAAMRRARVMDYRTAIRRSPCDPPGLRPLSLCTIHGTPNADRIHGTRRRDWVCAGRGRDVVNVLGGGADVVRCGRGFDRVRVGSRDRVVGRKCEQVLH